MRLSLIAPLALAAVVACGGAPSDADDSSENIEALVEPTTRVTDAKPGVDVEVKDDALVFPAPLRADVAQAANGDVLVSGHGSGFCRRVKGRREENGKIVIATEDAAITDVFRQAHVQTTPVSETPSLSPQGFDLPLPALGVSGIRLPLGDTGSDVTIEEGSYQMTPHIDYDLVVRDKRVDRMKLVVGANASSKLKVKYHIVRPPYAGTGATLNFGEPGKKVYETPPRFAVVWVGYVPVVLVIRVELLAGFQLQIGGDVSGESSFDTDGHVNAGVSYDGTWHNLSSSHLDVRAEGAPTFASTSLGGDVTLTAKLSVSVYGVVGPWVELQAYAGLGRESGTAARLGTSDVFGELGLRGLVGVEAAPFGKVLVGYQAVVFDENLHVAITRTDR